MSSGRFLSDSGSTRNESLDLSTAGQDNYEEVECRDIRNSFNSWGKSHSKKVMEG